MLHGDSSEARRQSLSSSTGGLGISTHDCFQSNTRWAMGESTGSTPPLVHRTCALHAIVTVPDEGHPPS